MTLGKRIIDRINNKGESMKPENATSPKTKIIEKEIIYSSPNGFSIAAITWGESKCPRIGIRWNGDNGQKGYPTTRFGHPSWFILPKEVALAMCDTINDARVTMIINASSDAPFNG